MNTLFFFRIIISGASGANGRKNEANGKANQIRALVHLEANETLFLLIGQMGSSACEQTGVSWKMVDLSWNCYLRIDLYIVNMYM